MNYISTRGAGIGERHTFSDILLGGLAKDGGLYLPAEYPKVSADELARWRGLPYADLAFEILSKFCDDVPADDLRAITRRTYTADVYSNTRHGENAADITRILADTGISIDALLQKESEHVDASKKGETDIILITHETVEKNVNAAIAQIEKLATVKSSVTKLRMEGLN